MLSEFFNDTFKIKQEIHKLITFIYDSMSREGITKSELNRLLECLNEAITKYLMGERVK